MVSYSEKEWIILHVMYSGTHRLLLVQQYRSATDDSIFH